ncbi:hypothetical protein C8R47DRAFT_1078833 [Mycena vitilis]|nr:hypothetical protein C8R47DRAFT_1078833 [Mycena vitilis]
MRAVGADRNPPGTACSQVLCSERDPGYKAREMEREGEVETCVESGKKFRVRRRDDTPTVWISESFRLQEKEKELQPNVLTARARVERAALRKSAPCDFFSVQARTVRYKPDSHTSKFWLRYGAQHRLREVLLKKSSARCTKWRKQRCQGSVVRRRVKKWTVVAKNIRSVARRGQFLALIALRSTRKRRKQVGYADEAGGQARRANGRGEARDGVAVPTHHVILIDCKQPHTPLLLSSTITNHHLKIRCSVHTLLLWLQIPGYLSWPYQLVFLLGISWAQLRHFPESWRPQGDLRDVFYAIHRQTAFCAAPVFIRGPAASKSIRSIRVQAMAQMVLFEVFSRAFQL